jgi:RNA polymerase sigma factor (sigma-70 family)
MVNGNLMAKQFEDNRAHLHAVAYRMLGSVAEADDAVQEAWLRLSRAGASDVANLTAWLTTVVGRVCLDMLRARKTRQAEPLDEHVPDPVVPSEDGTDPEHEALLADSIGLALLVVLDMLAPAERLAFVLHDMFAVPFEEIAPIVDRSPAATRQLASRARRRVQGATALPGGGPNRQREVVEAFLAAARGGDFDALLAVLDPGVVLRADSTAVALSAAFKASGAVLASESVGVAAVVEFSRRAQAAQLALIDGAAGAVWVRADRVLVAFGFTTVHGKVTEIDLVADRDHLDQLDIQILSGVGQ